MSRIVTFQGLREQGFENQPEVIQRLAQEIPALVQRLAETSLKPEGIDTALQKAAELLQEGQTVILDADWREQDRKVQIVAHADDELPVSDPSIYASRFDTPLDQVGASVLECYDHITYYLDGEFGNRHLLHTDLECGKASRSWETIFGITRHSETTSILGRNFFGNIRSYRTDGVFSKIMLVLARILGTSFKKEAVSRGLENLKEKITSRFQPLEQPTYTNTEKNILLRIKELQNKLRA